MAETDTVRETIVPVGQEKPTAQKFSQPTGISVDTSTGTLRMTSSFTSLKDYLKHLNLFGETFGLHTKTVRTSVVVIPQEIERLQQVYSFDKKSVDGVMSFIGTTPVTQSPQGTVSPVVTEDAEKRILRSLRDINDLLDRVN